MVIFKGRSLKATKFFPSWILLQGNYQNRLSCPAFQLKHINLSITKGLILKASTFSIIGYFFFYQKRARAVCFISLLCLFQYKTEGDLDRHLRAIHLDERPFICHYCKHGFNKKSNLVKHVKMVHERVRPFQCDQVSTN